MSAMFNSGYNGKFDRMGRKVRNNVQQAWTIGASVNVGFLKGLTVKTVNADGSYDLVSSKGVWYNFAPHMGIQRIETLSMS